MTPHSLFLIDPFGWMILDTALKATVLITVGTGVVWLFARSSAALRHRIWALLFIALLLLPALGPALPGWDWQIIPRGWQVATQTAQETSQSQTDARLQKTPSDPIVPGPATGSSVAGASGTVCAGHRLRRQLPLPQQTTPIRFSRQCKATLQSPPRAWLAFQRRTQTSEKDVQLRRSFRRFPRVVGWQSPGWVVRSWLCCRWPWDSWPTHVCGGRARFYRVLFGMDCSSVQASRLGCGAA